VAVALKALALFAAASCGQKPKPERIKPARLSGLETYVMEAERVNCGV
jgi:hypothetical protein